MKIDLTGQVALVTGGTSGIGAETALVLADCGARVMITGRRENAARDVASGIEQYGGAADFALGDITVPEFAESAIAKTIERFGCLTILVNAAGAICRGNAEETSMDDWRNIMAINVDGTFYMSRAAIPEMRKASGGSIINIGSTVGLVGAEGLAAYCASKGAVVNLTRAMALDHAKDGIRINAVNPGAVDTPMLISGREAGEAHDIREANREEIPQGWLPKPQEIAHAIAFLASDLSQHITGAALPIDGGYTAA